MKRCVRLIARGLISGHVLIGAAAWSAENADRAGSEEKIMPVTVAFEMARGHILVPGRVNGSQPLWFMLDTGFTVTMIHPARARELQLERAGSTTIMGIAGEEHADVFTGATIDVAGASYTPRRMAALPSDGRRRRDGILGSGFFRRFVVVIDFQAKTIQLHEPSNFRYHGGGEVLPMHFRRTTPWVEVSIHLPKRAPVSGRFEVDTGCDDALCVGRDFVEANKLVDLTVHGHVEERQGIGGNARVQTGNLLHLQLGGLKVDEAPSNFFLDGSPVDKDLAGHMGLGALRPFRVIFDYSRDQLILEPYATKPVE